MLLKHSFDKILELEKSLPDTSILYELSKLTASSGFVNLLSNLNGLLSHEVDVRKTTSMTQSVKSMVVKKGVDTLLDVGTFCLYRLQRNHPFS